MMDRWVSPYIDQVYEFKGRFDVPSRCGLKIVKKSRETIVIATELVGDNPGTTVTHFCDRLASLVCGDYGIDPSSLVFIEHFPDKGSKLAFYQETFDRVSFTLTPGGFTEPKWRRLTKEEVDSLLTG